MDPIAGNDWMLTALVFAPLAGALIMALFPKEEEGLHKQLALVTSLVTLGLGVWLLLDFDYDRAGQIQHWLDKEWIEVIGAGYTIGVDGMSLPLIALTVLVMPLVFVYSWDHIPSPGNAKAFLMLMLILETGMIGTFVAQDLILFFVFFEVVLLPMFFMIAVWGGEDRRYASLKFFLYTLFGSALMLLGFLALFFLSGRTRSGRCTRSTCVDLTNNAGLGVARSSQLLDLRRHVPRVRREGSDVPVPHVAARCPHSGPHRGLGHPGGRAPEARHLRLHPHRYPDAARGRRGVGAVSSVCSQSSASSTERSAVWPRPT